MSRVTRPSLIRALARLPEPAKRALRDAYDTAGHRLGGTGAASLAGTVRVPALSLETLLERHVRGARVDYLKMDVGGAEAAIRRDAGEWARPRGVHQL
jgi:Methyltransferase FkbM domain